MKRNRFFALLLVFALVFSLMNGAFAFDGNLVEDQGVFEEEVTDSTLAPESEDLVALDVELAMCQDPVPLNVTFDSIVQVREAGAFSAGLIIDLGEGITVDDHDVTMDKFVVTDTTTRRDPAKTVVAQDFARTVTAAYTSDVKELGLCTSSGRYIVLELDLSACAVYSGVNNYVDHNLVVSVTSPVGDYSLNATQGATVTPIFDDFEYVANPVAGYTNEHYRVYIPESDEPLPLVLWNHGAGETYRYSNNAGNEGMQIYANMGGVGWVMNAPEDCIVLAPQRGTGVGAPGYSVDGVAAYIHSLIKAGVADASRIYVSGCSAGGGETHRYINNAIHSSIFAAAIPICPAGTLSEVQAAALTDMPIWYVHAQNDPTVRVASSNDSYNRLVAAGSDVARKTIYPSVFGNDAAEYNGHWSWVMLLNNLYVEEYGTKFMDWLFSVRKDAETVAVDVTFDSIVQVREAGAFSAGVIIDLGEGNVVNSAYVDANSFVVTDTTTMRNEARTVITADFARSVTKAYASAVNELGKPAGYGRYIVLELDLSTCTSFSMSTFRNSYVDHNIKVSVAEQIGNYLITATQDATVTPVFDDFKYVANPVEGYTNEHYRVYIPDSPNPLPLVLWHHGMGEGYGYSNNAGNEGMQIFANMGGVGWVMNAPEDCIVLAPQRDRGTGAPGYSAAGVIAYINYLIDEGIADENRVYVSGCSMGGRETHTYITNASYASVFAAAIPICPASTLSVAQAAALANMPIWYVHAQNDPTVKVASSNDSYNRLVAAGSIVARKAIYDGVFGDDADDYNGHWSWVMLLNNLYVEEYGTTFMDWLFAQTKVAADYSQVEAAIARAGEFSRLIYDFTDVDAAISNVHYGLTAANQSLVDGYAAAINNAINALAKFKVTATIANDADFKIVRTGDGVVETTITMNHLVDMTSAIIRFNYDATVFKLDMWELPAGMSISDENGKATLVFVSALGAKITADPLELKFTFRIRDGLNPEQMRAELTSVTLSSALVLDFQPDSAVTVLKYHNLDIISGDDATNITHLDNISDFFGMTNGDDSWWELAWEYDFNNDGVIDTFDVMLLIQKII